MINLSEVFEKYDDDFLEFDRVENKLHPRPDLCGFLLLDKLVPNPGNDIVGGAEHDEIYLIVDCDKLTEVATELDILTLIRCGIRYIKDYDSLAMFV